MDGLTELLVELLVEAGGGDGDGAEPSDSVMGDDMDAFDVPGGVKGAR